MFQALDLEDTFTLPMIHRYTFSGPPSPTQKNALGLSDLARGRELVRGNMYLKHCDKSGKLQIKVVSVMWPGKRSFPAMLQSDAYTKMHYY